MTRICPQCNIIIPSDKCGYRSMKIGQLGNNPLYCSYKCSHIANTEIRRKRTPKYKEPLKNNEA